MATMSLTYPDVVAQRIVDALCAAGGYDTLPTTPPRPARAAFAKSVVVSYLMSVTRDYEAERDAQVAQTAARAKVDGEVTIA